VISEQTLAVAVDERAAVVRAAAVTLAAANVALLVVAIQDPARFGLTLPRVLLLGVPNVAIEVAVAAVPWSRVLRWRHHRFVLRGHVAYNIVGLIGGLHLSRGQSPEFLWIVALLLVYSAAVLQVREHVVAVTTLLSGTIAVLAAAGTAPSDVSVPLIGLAGVAGLAAVASWLIWQALDRMTEQHERARRVADAMTAVVRATEHTTVDSDRILQTVTEAAGQLANELAGLYVFAADGQTLRYAATHRIPPHLIYERFRPNHGVVGAVLREQATVVMDDYAGTVAAMPDYRAAGLRAAIGTPIRIGDEIVGVLVAGRYHPWAYIDEEIAAFELLADHAGRALELSREIAADRRALARLEALEAMKQDFVATVSHELRTPLTVILGLGETLARHHDALGPDQRCDLLARLNANAATLNRIVGGLLDAAALDRGLVVAESAPVDVAGLVRRSVDRLATLLADHPIEVRGPAEALAVGDPVLLERVIDNLLTNVERHTPAGTRCTVEVSHTPRHVEVTIHDAGPGIDRDVVQRLGQRFVRGGEGNARPTRGLGLGLALADEVLRLHGSRLEIISGHGAGTRFSFVLPRASVPVSALV
jgi:K+-sensing histidine kinase KdpD